MVSSPAHTFNDAGKKDSSHKTAGKPDTGNTIVLVYFYSDAADPWSQALEELKRKRAGEIDIIKCNIDRPDAALLAGNAKPRAPSIISYDGDRSLYYFTGRSAPADDMQNNLAAVLDDFVEQSDRRRRALDAPKKSAVSVIPPKPAA